MYFFHNFVHFSEKLGRVVQKCNGQFVSEMLIDFLQSIKNISSGQSYVAAIVDAILKLEQFDMVEVAKNQHGAPQESRNQFQGWRMP